MKLTDKEIERLTNVELMKLLATRCGICTESQFKALLHAVHVDFEQTMLNYQFGELRNGELKLTEEGRICAEVILRVTPQNSG